MKDFYRTSADVDDEEVTQPSQRFDVDVRVPIVPIWRAVLSLLLLEGK